MMPIISTRIIAMAGAAILLVGALLFGVRQCQKQRSAASQARVERSQAEAASNSAADAIGTVANSAAGEAATERTGDDHEAAIRAAPGNAPIAPSVNRAARRGMCDYRANRNKPECRVQPPAPR